MLLADPCLDQSCISVRGARARGRSLARRTEVRKPTLKWMRRRSENWRRVVALCWWISNARFHSSRQRVCRMRRGTRRPYKLRAGMHNALGKPLSERLPRKMNVRAFNESRT